MRTAALVWLLPLFVSGCFEGAGGEAIEPNPTLVAVAPEDFIGEVPCAQGPGSLETYVVRLFDHGTTEEPRHFELPASVVDSGGGVYRPVPCTQATVFGHVAAGHKYSAVVEAYDRKDLHALGAGSAVLVDGAGQHAQPRWTTQCGRDAEGNLTAGATISALYTTRFVRGCEPLKLDQQSETAIRVDVSQIQNAPGCGSGADQVERYSVRLRGDPASELELACGEVATFSDLTPGAQYHFELLAYEGGQTVPRWGTTCFRVAKGGASVNAACDPLQQQGVLEIDAEALLSDWGLSCGTSGDLSAIIATLGDETLESCSSLSFVRAPGSYSISVASARWDETPGPGAVCSGDVLPGWITRATCTTLPVP